MKCQHLSNSNKVSEVILNANQYLSAKYLNELLDFEKFLRTKVLIFKNLKSTHHYLTHSHNILFLYSSQIRETLAN